MNKNNIKSFAQAQSFLSTLIPKGSKDRFPANEGIKRTVQLLKHLGDPQEKPQIVHIAGTSGKGTTASIVSLLLKEHGLKVGLHLSPHLFDVRERMLINSKMISSQKFVKNLSAILPAIKTTNKETGTKLTYFEVLTALAFYTFAKEKVDVAVIETGMGGTFDATNTVKNKGKVAVITRIGKDHTQILGNTLEKIASQKAGIVKPQNIVVALKQEEKINKVIKSASKKETATLHLVNVNPANTHEKITKDQTIFSYQDKSIQLKNTPTKLIGKHQVENIYIALKTLELTLKKLEIKQNRKSIAAALKNISVPGRFDIIKINGKTLILDGAHNPQKTKALTTTFKAVFNNKQATVIFAVKNGKNAKEMLDLLLPITEALVITSFHATDQDLVHLSQKPKEIEALAQKLKFKKTRITDSPQKALNICLQQSNKLCLITGSLYYLAQIYETLKKLEKTRAKTV